VTVSEKILAAFVDGELSEADRERIAAAIAADADLRARADRIRTLRDRLTARYGPVADEPLPEHLAGLLKPSPESTPGNVLDLDAARMRRSRAPRLPWWGRAAAIAATLLLGVALGRFGLGEMEGDVISRDGALAARGELARALDTQLASTQSPTAPVRIGITFHDTRDRLCRTFASETIAGLACRSGDAWRLQATTTPRTAPAETAYRQAASPDPFILQAAQAIMKGDALDAPAERAALKQLTARAID
jgi:hypothetical protein